MAKLGCDGILATAHIVCAPSVVQDPALFAKNWGNLWRIISGLPEYRNYMQGRVFVDLINEAGCVASGDL